MRSTIDRGGRVVVPKAIRDEIGLSPGMAVDIGVRDGAVIIAPAAAAMRLLKRGGGLVAVSDEPLPALTTEQVRATLEAARR